MNKNLFIVRNEASSEANILLYGVIGDYWYSDNPVTARALQRQLTLLSDFKRINLHLNGPGGDVHEGLLILNTILADKGDRIHVYNDGVCCSMMAVLLLSVPAERRHAAKASLTMIHQASTYAWGNSDELREAADMLDKHDDVLAGVFADGLGLTINQVKAKWFDGKDHWFTATEGAAEGLFTVEDYEISEIPENPRDQSLERIAAFYAKPVNNKSQSKITNSDTMGLLSNKFKSISALAKVAAADRTAAHFEAVKAELEAEGLTGVTLVPEDELQEKVDAADKVPGLEKQVNDLGVEKTTLTQKVSDLQKIVDEQKKELGKPAEEIKNPVTDKIDSVGITTPVEDYTTSVDIEARKYWG
jgi:ATP-dependent Clp protease protease subunit